MAAHRPGVTRDPIRMALAVGLAGAILVLSLCGGCGLLIKLTSDVPTAPTPSITVPTLSPAPSLSPLEGTP